MRRVFPNYKRDYEMAVKVLGAMAEEIIKLREEIIKLRKENRKLNAECDNMAEAIKDLREEKTMMNEIINEQGEKLFGLHADIRDAKAALNREK